MTSNHNILDQYVLSLQGRHNFLTSVMDTAAPVPRVDRASMHMEAMGLWRPSLGPHEPARDVARSVNVQLAAGSCSAGWGNSFHFVGCIPCTYVVTWWYPDLVGSLPAYVYVYLAPHRGRARYCNAHVCLFVCLCVCVFVRVFAKFQSVISQPFLNRSLWNLAYNIFRILGQRSRS